MKNNIRKKFKFFTIRGSLTVKKLPNVKKRLKKKFKKKNLKVWTKWNRKIGGRSFNITIVINFVLPLLF